MLFKKKPKPYVSDNEVLKNNIIEQLIKRVWILENPPKLKVGQKVDFTTYSRNTGNSIVIKGVITSIEVECTDAQINELGRRNYHRKVSYFDGEHTISICESQWINRYKGK